jgi:signal peptidase II
LLWTVVVLVIVTDQVSKLLIQMNLDLGESVPAHGLVRLTYVTNTGGAFGMFAGQIIPLTIASFVGVGVLLLFYRSHPWPGRLVRLSLGLQLGGAIGNLIDRIYAGAVVDFIDVGRWPIFNVADSSIVGGISLLLVMFIFFEDGGQVRRRPAVLAMATDLASLGATSVPQDSAERPPPEVGC